MTFLRTHLKLLTVAATCLAAGAGAGVIANAGAATSSGAGSHGARTGLHSRRLLARAVHGDLVVATRSGFRTVTFDRGFVQSVSGQQLTFSEGTKKATYKTLTLTIPSDARVRDNGKRVALASLQPGQHVLVVQGPKRTLVVARTPRTP
jgi:hypothetical protein